MDIVIELAHPSDAAALLDFLRQVGGETDNLTFGAEGVPFTVEDEERFLASLKGSRDGVMLVAKAGGRIIGNASLSRLPRRMSHRGELAVAVAKGYWNQGIGGRLLCGLVDFAKQNEFDVIDLQVRSDNRAAIHLYEQYGFEKLATYPGFFKIDDRLLDFDYMYLKLR